MLFFFFFTSEVAPLYKKPEMQRKQEEKQFLLLITQRTTTVSTLTWSLMEALPNQAYLLFSCQDGMGERCRQTHTHINSVAFEQLFYEKQGHHFLFLYFQDDDQKISSETSTALGCHFNSCQCFCFGLVSIQAASLDTLVEMTHSQIHPINSFCHWCTTCKLQLNLKPHKDISDYGWHMHLR